MSPSVRFGPGLVVAAPPPRGGVRYSSGRRAQIKRNPSLILVIYWSAARWKDALPSHSSLNRTKPTQKDQLFLWHAARGDAARRPRRAGAPLLGDAPHHAALGPAYLDLETWTSPPGHPAFAKDICTLPFFSSQLSCETRLFVEVLKRKGGIR